MLRFTLAWLLLTGSVLADDDLGDRITAALEGGPFPTNVAIWCGRPDGSVIVEQRADVPFSAASSIKTAILVELLDEFEDRLDERPREAAAILSPTHPAIRHFPANARAEIVEALSKATVADLGSILMTYEDRSGEKYSNAVYNAASNVAIAMLGGPEGCTKRMHARSRELQGIVVGRYMLVPATPRVDNVVTANSLAALYRHLANGSLPGLSKANHARVAEFAPNAVSRSKTLYVHKTGGLTAPRVVRADAGWATKDGRRVVFVILVNAAPGPNARARYDALGKRVLAARDALVIGALLQ